MSLCLCFSGSGFENVRVTREGDLIIIIPPVTITHTCKWLPGCEEVHPSRRVGICSLELIFSTAVVTNCDNTRLRVPPRYPFAKEDAARMDKLRWQLIPAYVESYPYLLKQAGINLPRVSLLPHPHHCKATVS